MMSLYISSIKLKIMKKEVEVSNILYVTIMAIVYCVALYA